MSLPVIPERTQEQAFTDLLESIALEETALAHFMNAEAEKLQSAATMMTNGTMSTDSVVAFQESVTKVMQTAIKMQMLLQFKLDNTLEAKLALEGTPV